MHWNNCLWFSKQPVFFKTSLENQMEYIDIWTGKSFFLNLSVVFMRSIGVVGMTRFDINYQSQNCVKKICISWQQNSVRYLSIQTILSYDFELKTLLNGQHLLKSCVVWKNTIKSKLVNVYFLRLRWIWQYLPTVLYWTEIMISAKWTLLVVKMIKTIVEEGYFSKSWVMKIILWFWHFSIIIFLENLEGLF